MSIQAHDIKALLKKRPIVSLAIVMVFFAILLHYFRSGRADELKLEMTARAAVEDRVRSNVANAQNLESQLAAASQAVVDLRKRLMNPADVAQNLQVFYEIESASQVKADIARGQISAADPKKPANFTAIPTTMNVSGSYAQLLDFLRRVEGSPYLIRLNDWAIRSGASEEGEASGPSAILTMSLSVNILGQK
jgi:Tfp pilus assembly protein PilO